ncbi:MAG: dCTP deaminase domain-containing protein [Cetobacterium sp.]
MIRGFEVVKDEFRKHSGVDAILPTRGSRHAIAYDVYSPVKLSIKPNERVLIWTDVKACFGEDEALLMNVRSSMGMNGVMMGNSSGWVESDYYNNPKNDGNLGVCLYNFGDEGYNIEIGDRIAQVMFINYLTSDNGNTEKERDGGYGSTGK